MVQPDAFEQVGIKITPIPRWARDWYALLTQHLNDDFPCLYAAQARLLVGLARNVLDREELEAIRIAVLDYLEIVRALSVDEAARRVLIILVKPDGSAKSETAYANETWHVLQYLHDHDPKPWPADVPVNPAHPFWSFCFDGDAIFVNASTPAHVRRRSRNLGPGLALVIQTRCGIDWLAPADRSGDAIRKRIRERANRYDSAPTLPMFGSSGRANDRDWKIFFLPDDEEPIPARCPLKLHRSQKF